MFKIHLLSISPQYYCLIHNHIKYSFLYWPTLLSCLSHLFRLGTLRPSSAYRSLARYAATRHVRRRYNGGRNIQRRGSLDILSFHCGSMGGSSNCDSEFLICFKCLLGMAYSGNHVKPNHKLLFHFCSPWIAKCYCHQVNRISTDVPSKMSHTCSANSIQFPSFAIICHAIFQFCLASKLQILEYVKPI